MRCILIRIITIFWGGWHTTTIKWIRKHNVTASNRVMPFSPVIDWMVTLISICQRWYWRYWWMKLGISLFCESGETFTQQSSISDQQWLSAILSDSEEKRTRYLGTIICNFLQFVFFYTHVASTHICSNKITAEAANIQWDIHTTIINKRSAVIVSNL